MAKCKAEFPLVTFKMIELPDAATAINEWVSAQTEKFKSATTTWTVTVGVRLSGTSNDQPGIPSFYPVIVVEGINGGDPRFDVSGEVHEWLRSLYNFLLGKFCAFKSTDGYRFSRFMSC